MPEIIKPPIASTNTINAANPVRCADASGIEIVARRAAEGLGDMISQFSNLLRI